MTKRAAIYARVSTEDQDEGTSPATQLEECRKLCAENGWEVVKEYRVAFSADYMADVPDWQDMMAAARRRDFDVLVTLKSDRLARHHWDLGTTLRTCERAGVEVAFVKDKIPEGEIGDVYAFIKGHGDYSWRKGIIEATGRGRKVKMLGLPEPACRPDRWGAKSSPSACAGLTSTRQRAA